MERRITPLRVELLRLLITKEPTILAKVQSWNEDEKKTAKIVQVKEDGSVYFYFNSSPIWWQKLFNTFIAVSIVDVAIRIADAITGSGNTRNEAAFDGLTKALLDEAIKNKDYDCVVDILFDSMRNASTGELHSKYINKEAIQKYAKEHNLHCRASVDSDVFSYLGIEIRPGVVAPVRLGRVVPK